jgi:hypothetical protein
MAAPNIVNVTTITGITTFVRNISVTDSTVIVSNPASSNKVLKINTLMAAGIGNTIGVSFTLHNVAAAGVGHSVSIGTTITVPTGSSLVVIGKDNPIYLEENRSIGATLQSGIGGTCHVLCSYEEIS